MSWSNAQGDYYVYNYADWRRAAFIGNVLYAITPDGVRAAPISDFESMTSVELKEE